MATTPISWVFCAGSSGACRWREAVFYYSARGERHGRWHLLWRGAARWSPFAREDRRKPGLSPAVLAGGALPAATSPGESSTPAPTPPPPACFPPPPFPRPSAPPQTYHL